MTKFISLVCALFLLISSVFCQITSDFPSKANVDEGIQVLLDAYPIQSLNISQAHNRKRGLKKKLESYISESQNLSSGVWVTNQVTFSYDSDWNNTLQLNKKFSLTTSNYENFERIEFTFNDSNLLSSQTKSLWISTSNLWKDTTKLEYTYLPNHATESRTEKRWDSLTLEWKNVQKLSYTYHPNENLDLVLIQYYVDSISTWVEFIRAKEYYLLNGNKDRTLLSVKYANTSVWIDRTERNYFYDSGIIESTIDSNWNIVTNIKEPARKDSLFYNSVGNKISTLNFNWSMNDTIWEINGENNRSFDTNYLSEDVIVPFGYSYSRMLRGVESSIVGPNGNKTVYYTQNLYYTDELVNSVIDIENGELLIYPNPATDVVTFQIPNGVINLTVEIYDMKGMLVISNRLQGATLDVSNLEKGAYYFLITAENTKYTGKLMKL